MKANLKVAPRQIYAHRCGLLALKPERIERAVACGAKVLEFGDRMPDDAILLADCRPKHFKGCRTADDPADTAIFVGNVFTGKYITRDADFERALKKAIALAGSTGQ